MASKRVICVWMPRFRLAVEARERPEPSGRPIVIIRPSGRWQELVECPPQLEAEGMRPGMPLKEAESRWPGAAFRPDEPERYARAIEPVLEVLDTFSPTIECAPTIDGLHSAFLDGTGLEPLYGPEEQLGRRMARERAARLGLRTLGDFARLPPNALRHSFGPEGVRARALGAGHDDEPLRPRPTPLVVRDELEFEWIEESLDRLTFALKRLADRLSARLLRHGLGCGRLGVTWRLEDGSTRE